MRIFIIHGAEYTTIQNTYKYYLHIKVTGKLALGKTIHNVSKLKYKEKFKFI